MLIISKFILYFIFYSFIGWVIEVLGKLIELKRFVNRGFLIGPICPIYGYGGLIIILFIDNTSNDFMSIFLKSILICSILEYTTSYVMEKLFKARWWDYSNQRFNINGRICLETMIPFGLMGCLVINFIHPFLKKIIKLLPNNLIISISIILLIIYLIDNIISLNVMNKIKKEIKKQAIDNTEMIRKKIMEWLSFNSAIYRHIKNAFPRFKIYNKVKNKILKKL